jgi:hypothetical protein
MQGSGRRADRGGSCFRLSFLSYRGGCCQLWRNHHKCIAIAHRAIGWVNANETSAMLSPFCRELPGGDAPEMRHPNGSISCTPFVHAERRNGRLASAIASQRHDHDKQSRGLRLPPSPLRSNVLRRLQARRQVHVSDALAMAAHRSCSSFDAESGLRGYDDNPRRRRSTLRLSYV